MILLIEYFKSPNQNRDSEYLFCINQNLNNPLIEKIYVFISDESELLIQNPKLRTIKSSTRPTFNDLFEFANKSCVGKKCIIANTDIFLDQTISSLLDFDLNNKFLALTRWDIFQDKGNWFVRYYDNPWMECHKSDGTIDEDESISTSHLSQDCWIFSSPIKLDDRLKFLMGKPGCDNRITQIMHENEYEVSNPSLLVKVLHYHQTNYRTYTNQDVIPGPYLLVRPTDDLNKKSKIKTIPNFQVIRK
jgi:hypothetical protein